MYTSTDVNGTSVPVTGMVALPNAAGSNRPVVAWAHGTVGPSVKSAPSMSKQNMSDLEPWINTAMAKGLIVAATDYQGLGVTTTKSDYLVGHQEAADVINSVRAARELPGANAGTSWLGWGHSQGGHSIAWAADLANQIAPELQLRGIGLAAPAVPVRAIDEHDWNNKYGWVIGANAFPSWMTAHPGNDISGDRSATAIKNNAKLENMSSSQLGLYGIAQESRSPKVSYYRAEPDQTPRVLADIAAETPPPPPTNIPVFFSQGDKDGLVPPAANHAVVDQWRTAGVAVQSDYVAGANHFNIAVKSSDAFTDWATQVLATPAR